MLGQCGSNSTTLNSGSSGESIIECAVTNIVYTQSSVAEYNVLSDTEDIITGMVQVLPEGKYYAKFSCRYDPQRVGVNQLTLRAHSDFGLTGDITHIILNQRSVEAYEDTMMLETSIFDVPVAGASFSITAYGLVDALNVKIYNRILVIYKVEELILST